MRDSSDVCGARDTQFEQEFLDLFRAETVSAYDGRDRIGDFRVADYLAELDTVHVMRYSTRFSLHLRRIAGLGGTTEACVAWKGENPSAPLKAYVEIVEHVGRSIR
jgi:hypothetical protein